MSDESVGERVDRKSRENVERAQVAADALSECLHFMNQAIVRDKLNALADMRQESAEWFEEQDLKPQARKWRRLAREAETLATMLSHNIKNDGEPAHGGGAP